MKDRFPRASAPRPRLRPAAPETASGPRRGAIPQAVLGVAAVSLGLAAVVRLARAGSAPSAAGLAVLLAAKMAALAAFGASRSRGEGGPRGSLAESLTLGSLLAFVASLTLGPLAELPRSFVVLPRSFVVLDWIAALIVVAAVRPPKPAAARTAEPARPASDPSIAGAIRGRVVLLVSGDRAAHRALIEEIRIYQPDRLLIEPITSAESARRIVVAHRPDVILHAPPVGTDTDAGPSTRWLANEALRSGADVFALIVPDGTHGLSERILRALIGLTRTRLIRIRLGDGVTPEDSARRLLRVAARGHDGTIVTLGRSGGLRVEDPSFAGDADALWSELDRIDPARA